MIKLFNKKRKQLLEENKTGRYLKYAIGEIVLVMIGILLALQVNTWNENRQLKKEEIQLMKSLHKEFSKNLILFDKHFGYQLKKIERIENIMSINARSFSRDSLKLLIAGVTGAPTFNPSQGIYNSAISSGKIELISNVSLKESVSGFQDLLIDYREDEDNVDDFANQNLRKVLLSEMTWDNYDAFINNAKVSKAEEQRIKQKYLKLIESKKFESQMIFLRLWMNPVLEEGKILKEEMVSIINLLETEIEKYNLK